MIPAVGFLTVCSPKHSHTFYNSINGGKNPDEASPSQTFHNHTSKDKNSGCNEVKFDVKVSAGQTEEFTL